MLNCSDSMTVKKEQLEGDLTEEVDHTDAAD
jgi:hypothetical protein